MRLPTSTAQIKFHSSNTWVGAGKAYVKTSTSQQTSDSVVSRLEFVLTRAILLSHWTNRLKQVFALNMGQAVSVASFR